MQRRSYTLYTEHTCTHRKLKHGHKKANKTDRSQGGDTRYKQAKKGIE